MLKKVAKTNLCGTFVFRRRSLLCLLSRTVKIKRRFWTSSIIILTMCLSGRSRGSLQVRPQCQTVSYTAVRLTYATPTFFVASKESLMFWVSSTISSTVNFPRLNPTGSLGSINNSLSTGINKPLENLLRDREQRYWLSSSRAFLALGLRLQRMISISWVF